MCTCKANTYKQIVGTLLITLTITTVYPMSKLMQCNDAALYLGSQLIFLAVWLTPESC